MLTGRQKVERKKSRDYKSTAILKRHSSRRCKDVKDRCALMTGPVLGSNC